MTGSVATCRRDRAGLLHAGPVPTPRTGRRWHPVRGFGTGFAPLASGVFAAQKLACLFAPGGRKEGNAAKKDATIKQNIMVEQNIKKNQKGGRPIKQIKRVTTLGIRLTNTEHLLIKAKANKAGITMTSLIRELAIHGTVVSRLSQEEKEYVRQLIGMATNLNQLVKLANSEGLLSALVKWEEYRNRLDSILKMFKDDK